MRELIMTYINVHPILTILLVILLSMFLLNVFVFVDSVAALYQDEYGYYDRLLKSEPHDLFVCCYILWFIVITHPGYRLYFEIAKRQKKHWDKRIDKEIAKINKVWSAHGYNKEFKL